MDFPINLEKFDFVTGLEEFQQTLSIILKEPLRNFLQSPKVGAYFDVHSTDANLIKYGIENTIKTQIPELVVLSVDVNLPNILIRCKYKDKIINFKYSTDEN